LGGCDLLGLEEIFFEADDILEAGDPMYFNYFVYVFISLGRKLQNINIFFKLITTLIFQKLKKNLINFYT